MRSYQDDNAVLAITMEFGSEVAGSGMRWFDNSMIPISQKGLGSLAIPEFSCIVGKSVFWPESGRLEQLAETVHA